MDYIKRIKEIKNQKCLYNQNQSQNQKKRPLAVHTQI